MSEFACVDAYGGILSLLKWFSYTSCNKERTLSISLTQFFKNGSRQNPDDHISS